MPVAAELARRMQVKEIKRAEASVSTAPIIGGKKVGGEGASMPPLKDVLGSRGGQPQEGSLVLSSLTTKDRQPAPRTNDDDKKDAKGTAIFDYTDGGAAPAVELFAPLDVGSLKTMDGKQAPSSDVEAMCGTIHGECPPQVQEGKGGNTTDIFDLQVSGLKADNNKSIITPGPPDTAVCTVGSCSLTCD